MIDAIETPSTRLSPKLRHGRWIVVALGVLALLLCSAARAKADEPAVGLEAPAAEEVAPEAGPPPKPPVPEGGEQPVVAVEPPVEIPETPPLSSEPPPPAPEAPPVEPPPASEPPPPAPEPPPVSEPPAAEPPPPAPEQHPGPERLPVSEGSSGAGDASKERSGNETAGERSSEGSGESSAGASESASSPSAEGREAATRLLSPFASPTAAAGSSETVASEPQSATPELPAPHPAAQRPCTVAGLLSTAGASSLSVAGAPSIVGILVPGARGPAGVTDPDAASKSRGGSAAATRAPLSNTGPAPGGSSGGSAAGSSSGSATSTPATPVALLLQGAPAHEMYASGLTQPSWRTSFFALIPERPD